MADIRSTRPGTGRHGAALLSILLAVFLLVVSLLAAAAPAASARPGHPAAPGSHTKVAPHAKASPHVKAAPKAAADTLPTDISSGMPRTMRDELTGDFLGLGYDQRMRAEGSSLNIYDPPDRGGALKQSTFLDLEPAPDSVNYTDDQNNDYDFHTYAQYTSYAGGNQCGGCFQAVFNQYHVNTVYLAAAGGHLFIAGTKGDRVTNPGNQLPDDGYRPLLYEVPYNGTCASEGCVASSGGQVAEFENEIGIQCHNFGGCLPFGDTRVIGPTSLAAGMVGSTPVVAIGLSDFGVYIGTASTVSSMPNGNGNQFGGMATPDAAQTPATALAFDPAGTGLLAVGALEYGNVGYSVQVDGNAHITSYQTWNFQPGTGLLPSPMSAAIVHDSSGRPLVAMGMTDGTVRLVDPTVSGANVVASSPATGNAVVAINPIPRIDDTGGADDYAVAEQSGSDIVNTTGAVLRYDEADQTIGKQALAAGGGHNLPRTDFQSWYPGYKTGRFTVTNNSPDQVTVTLLQRSVSGYGCWYAPSFADGGQAFPQTTPGLTLASGQTSPTEYVMGAYTASTDGSCQGSDASAQWRAYLVVTPTAHPADARVVDLHLNKTLTAGPEVCDPADLQTTGVDVCDQVGGSITVTATRQPAQLAAFGLYSINIGGPALPTPTASPQITATRLTVSPRNTNNVYRFDVGPMTYNVPGMTAAQPQIQAVLPPLTVEGSTDGVNWTNLGLYMPVNKLNSSGSTITVGSTTGSPGATGSGSFFWQNAASGPAYTNIRVQAGTTPPSPSTTGIVLGSLPAPPPAASRITTVVASSGKNTSSTTVALEPNGVDQAQVGVVISASAALPTSDPAYNSVYYTDEYGSVVTNLYRQDDPTCSSTSCYANFVGAQPSAGAYPNTPSSGSSRRDVVAGTVDYDYVSSTGASRLITAHAGTGPGATVQPITINGNTLDLTSSGTTAATGFSLEGCADFANNSTTCTLAPITTPTAGASGRPALYQARVPDGGPLLGAQLLYQAQNSQGSLPLNWKSGGVKENLEPTTPKVSTTLVKMSPNNYLTDDDVDIYLATHGISQLFTAEVGP